MKLVIVVGSIRYPFENVVVEDVSVFVRGVCHRMDLRFEDCTFYLGEKGSDHPRLKPFPPSSRGSLPRILLTGEADELVVSIEPPSGVGLYKDDPRKGERFYREAMRVIETSGWRADMEEDVGEIIKAAMEKNWEDVIVALLAQGKISVSKKYDELRGGGTLMGFAISERRPGMVAVFLTEGADLTNYTFSEEGRITYYDESERLHYHLRTIKDELTQRHFRNAYLQGGVSPELCPFPNVKSDAKLEDQIVAKAVSQRLARSAALVSLLMANMPTSSGPMLSDLTQVIMSCLVSELIVWNRQWKPISDDVMCSLAESKSGKAIAELGEHFGPARLLGEALTGLPNTGDHKKEGKQASTPASGDAVVVYQRVHHILTQQATTVDYFFDPKGQLRIVRDKMEEKLRNYLPAPDLPKAPASGLFKKRLTVMIFNELFPISDWRGKFSPRSKGLLAESVKLSLDRLSLAQAVQRAAKLQASLAKYYSKPGASKITVEATEGGGIGIVFSNIKDKTLLPLASQADKVAAMARSVYGEVVSPKPSVPPSSVSSGPS